VLVESRKIRQRSRKEQRNIPVGVNCESMPNQELRVQKKAKNKEKRE